MAVVATAISTPEPVEAAHGEHTAVSVPTAPVEEAAPHFRDLDGDSLVQNPGDGFGVRKYFLGAQEHAQLASDAKGATVEVQLHAGHVITSFTQS